MAEKLLATTKTPVSMRDFARALLEVWPEATKEGAGVLWAHFAGETGDGSRCWNWNLGNHKHVRGDGYDYVALVGVWECVSREQAVKLIATGRWTSDLNPSHAVACGPNRVSIVATKDNPSSWFRAYPDLPTAMQLFVLGKKSGRYGSAWQFVACGNPDGYARELGARGYYTASPDVYAKALVAKHKTWMASPDFDLARADFEAHMGLDRIPEVAPVVHPWVEFDPRTYDEDT